MDTTPRTPPTCETVGPLIDEWIDDRLTQPERASFESHLEGCDACRCLCDDLRAIRHTARSMRPHAPRPDVWTRIARELAARTPAAPRPFWTGARVALAMAAVMVLSVAASLVILRTPQPPSPTRTTQNGAAGAAAHPSSPDAVLDVDEHLRIADANYQQAIAGLETIVASGQASLDPVVAATLQKNLGVIDQAIRESREAIKSQPTSQLAQTSLFDALRQKVALLEDTIALINVMRKGDQAGAARLIGGLSKS
ncbi:MAG: zf-HC2 domain-containing protein [Acidobacteriota bacterium]